MSSYKWPPEGSGGTVTSVALNMPGEFSVSGSPVINSGTLSVTWSSELANLVLASPNGSSGTPSFRALVAGDIPLLPYLSTTLGTANGLSVAGNTLSLGLSSTSTTGALSSADWNTFNGKQDAGNYITALTGDATASGPGSVPITLATVNANVGSFTNASITVNGKGLITAASSGTTGDLTDIGTDGITITGGAGAVLGTGTSIDQHAADTTHNGYLSSADWNTFNGKQDAGNYITALTGDVTAAGPGSVASSLVATSNATLTTLSALTTASSLASVGTVTSGTWNATTIAILHGGTGQTTANAAFNALSPMTTAGDIIYENATPVAARLAIGSTGNVLTVSGGIPVWAPPATNGTVTSVALTVPGFLSVSGSPITSSGTLAVTLATETANTVFAGPASGSATAPTFRALGVADMTVSTQTLTESAGATTIDWSLGNLFTLTLNANLTVTFSNKLSGQTIVVRLTNTASNFTVTWPTVRWAGGSAPTMTVGAFSDVYTFIYDGSNVYGSAVQNMS